MYKKKLWKVHCVVPETVRILYGYFVVRTMILFSYKCSPTILDMETDRVLERVRKIILRDQFIPFLHQFFICF